MALTQENRSAAISTALGADALVLASFSGSEELGRLFQFEVELLSEDHAVAFEKLIGENVTLRLNTARETTRYLNGYISRFVQRPMGGRYASYRATVVPWLWFLTRTSDCRIFQNKAVPDILEEVFKGHGFDAFERKLFGTYKEWEYCVQYRETDFNFVSRLMEQEGIYYYFKHEDGKHTLVLADSPDSHAEFEGYAELTFRPSGSGSSDTEHIRDWIINKELLAGAFVHTDFNFQKPKTDLKSEPATVAREHVNAEFEIFDHPGEYEELAEGNDYAKIRIQEIQSRHEILQARTDARGVAAGHTVEVKDLLREDQNRKYLIVSATHSFHTDAYESDSGGGGDTFNCSFNVIPATEHFRATRITPKPLIQGPQTAMVVGPKGEEIYTDEHARVKVQFHWDRYGKMDAESSCFIRVSQPWAGKGWGSQSTPRIGQEVIVEFIEGDPDRPIITGRVYNGENKPPYAGNGVVSGLKSQTHKGKGYNEMSLDDTAGKEEIKIHGQYNMNTVVEHDQTSTIHNNRTDKVDVDDSETVGNNQTGKVANNRSREVGNNETVKIGVNQDIDVGSNIVIKAGTSITLQCGASRIHMNQAGFITISGTVITTAAAVNASVTAPMTEVTGAALLTLAGAVIMEQGGVVRIDGAQLMHIGGDKVESIGKTSNLTKAPTTNVEATNLTLQGGGPTVISGTPIKLN